MHSYKPEDLFDENGTLRRELKELAPQGELRMSANPHANGGRLRKPLVVPDFRNYGTQVEKPGTKEESPTELLGGFLRDVMRRNVNNFRVDRKSTRLNSSHLVIS